MDDVILEISHVSKSFPGVKALNDVTFEVRRGDVHALVGENGAGKSTLMKILNGNYKRDEGTIKIDGKEVVLLNPLEARAAGISIIFQELNMIPNISVAENMFLGRLPIRKGIVDKKKLYEDTKKALSRVGFEGLDPKAIMRTLSVAQQQMIEIARAISYENTKIILMDEPTAALTNAECNLLFDVIRRLKQEGITIIYISHKLEEIFEICDRITIIRDGCVIRSADLKGMTIREITEGMVGREITDQFPKRPKLDPNAKEVLRVEGLCHGKTYHDISFSLRKGEVLGLAGLVGAGRTEIARGLFGIDFKDGGKIFIHGKEVNIKDPMSAIKYGLCYLSEDRKTEGLMGSLTVRLNTTASNLDPIMSKGLINHKKERVLVDGFIQKLRIRTPSMEQRVFNLSGGNMQKVVVAKWLNTDVDIYIFDEPTRGIDIGAKYEIYLLINELVAAGKAVIMISSELPEVIGMSDRVLIINKGIIQAEFDASVMTEQDFINNAI